MGWNHAVITHAKPTLRPKSLSARDALTMPAEAGRCAATLPVPQPPMDFATAESVRWNGQDCGTCSFDDTAYMEFDCSNVGAGGPILVGPTPHPTPLPTLTPTPRPTPLPGEPTYSPTPEGQRLCNEDGGTLLKDGKCKTCVDGNDFFDTICPLCEQIEEPQDINCNDFSCTDDYQTNTRNCRGCLGSNICLNYDCPVVATTDNSQCTCREFILEGRLCRTCSFDGEDGTLSFDCSNVGGPTSGSSSTTSDRLLILTGASAFLGMMGIKMFAASF